VLEKLAPDFKAGWELDGPFEQSVSFDIVNWGGLLWTGERYAGATVRLRKAA
jgi:hypothetical protein